MPVSNPTQVNWGAPGAIGAITPNTARVTTLTIGSTAKETRSATVPTSPSTGDLWLELDGSNFPIYGWWWRWNGTYWLSPDQRSDASFQPSTVATTGYIPCNSGFNYYLKSLSLITYATTTQDASNHWDLAISRTSATSDTGIAAISTTGNAANNWVRQIAAINTHINVSSTGTILFNFRSASLGAAGTLYATPQLIYNYARP